MIDVLWNNFRSALYRGLRPNVTTMGVSNFVYFYVATGLRNLIPDGLETTTTDLVINAVSGEFLISICSFYFSLNCMSKRCERN